MRNPIPATPTRPIPLPDCILRDGWWLTAALPVRPRPALRVVSNSVEEHAHGPHHTGRADTGSSEWPEA